MYDPDNPPNPIFQLFGTIASTVSIMRVIAN